MTNRLHLSNGSMPGWAQDFTAPPHPQENASLADLEAEYDEEPVVDSQSAPFVHQETTNSGIFGDPIPKPSSYNKFVPNKAPPSKNAAEKQAEVDDTFLNLLRPDDDHKNMGSPAKIRGRTQNKIKEMQKFQRKKKTDTEMEEERLQREQERKKEQKAIDENFFQNLRGDEGSAKSKPAFNLDFDENESALSKDVFSKPTPRQKTPRGVNNNRFGMNTKHATKNGGLKSAAATKSTNTGGTGSISSRDQLPKRRRRKLVDRTNEFDETPIRPSSSGGFESAVERAMKAEALSGNSRDDNNNSTGSSKNNPKKSSNKNK